MSLLIKALVVRADRFKSSMAVFNTDDSPPSSPESELYVVPSLVALPATGLASIRVFPAKAVYWLTKIAAASSKASRV